jgi:PRC-barrel domain
MRLRRIAFAMLLGLGLVAAATAAPQSQHDQPSGQQAQDEPKPSPEVLMNRRYPQPVRTGDLIGLPLLDYDDSTIGYVRDVVRTQDGKIFLIVPYGRWFGWLRAGGPFDWNRRPVGVPIETVAILGRQINAIDMSREDIDQLPAFQNADVRPVAPNEIIKIALGRR